MDSKIVRKGLFVFTLIGTLTIPRAKVLAEDQQSAKTQVPGAGIETILHKCDSLDEELDASNYLVPTKRGTYLDMGFADVYESSFLYIRSKPTKESKWLGKLYKNDAVRITGAVGEWTPVESGNVKGYAKTEYLIVGENAEKKAEKMVAKSKTPQEPEKVFSYAESKEEEKKRLEKEEAKRREQKKKAAEKRAKKAAKGVIKDADTVSGEGQDVVNYACQFIGNPYVWGGTDLNHGCDCSGFIQSVYKHFGVTMPRTSGEMRGAGKSVSYDNMQPGDVICYQGHVAMYIGKGQVVNAIDEAHGIGISNATMMPIITIRRLI